MSAKLRNEDGVPQCNDNCTIPFAILHNVGEDSEYSRPNPIRIVTIGVGIRGYNDHLLEQLAQYGNGWYRYIDTVAQARQTFSYENWRRLTQPFADQARAQVTWDSDLVAFWRIVGYENRVTPDATFRQNRREFAEVPAGAATTVLYELQLTDAGERARSLGTVQVRWQDPREGRTLARETEVRGDPGQAFSNLEPRVALGVVTGLSADIYASLDQGGYGTGGSDTPERSIALMNEYFRLGSQLDNLQAYQDVGWLINRIVEEVHTQFATNPEAPVRQGPGSGDTGYSP